ncbi:LolA family protein [Sphingomonas bacterium]|uniref:LolA family protein n=1 Tax=Sphingomonas bacterium TaxID=1895847 RepID=UPI001575D5A8|nr:outer membrane lipoprotein carrier protein LolA [Sphingomonas bacterium]
MIRSFFVPLLAFSPLLAGPAFATAPVAAAPVTGDLALVQQHLRALDSMTAAFVQTDRMGKVLTGTLTLKKPGRIRFQYQQGVPILIVAEGGALTFVDYSVKQVQRWPVKNSPLAVLLDPDRDIARYAHVADGGDPRAISVEAADPKHPEYGRITLIFTREAAAPAGLALEGWVMLDSQGNRTTVRLSDQRFNVAIPANSFAWTDPRPRGR